MTTYAMLPNCTEQGILKARLAMSSGLCEESLQRYARRVQIVLTDHGWPCRLQHEELISCKSIVQFFAGLMPASETMSH